MNSTPTKLEKVLEFIHANREFTWIGFLTKLNCQYSCGETNYLNLLVKAKYVERYARGKYRRLAFPNVQMSYNTLKSESVNPPRRPYMHPALGAPYGMNKSQFQHSHICSACAKKKGLRWPKGHCATQHYDECPYCKKVKGLTAITDWLKPDQKDINPYDWD